jgi:hypothetical protein
MAVGREIKDLPELEVPCGSFIEVTGMYRFYD